MRWSWRLSRVRDDDRVYPKKSSTGFVVFWMGEVRAGRVTAAEGATMEVDIISTGEWGLSK